MKKKRALLFAAAALFTLCTLAVAPAVAQVVHTDHAKKADFSRYHTYSWAQVKTENPLWEDRIKEAVDRDLQSKGLRKVDSDGDLSLTAVGATKDQQVYQTFYDTLPGWRWRAFGAIEPVTTVQNYHVGTLVLDMYDTQSKELVWRGTASNELSDKVDKNERHLDKAVDKMFKDFPPKGKD